MCVSESRLCGLLQLRAAFGAEARARIDFLSAIWAEEVGQGQLRAAVLAEFARRSRTAAGGTCYLRGIARRVEARTGKWIVRPCHLRLGGSLRLNLRLNGRLWWPHQIGRDGGGNGAYIELRGVVALLNLLALRLDIQFVLITGGIGLEVGRAAGAEIELDVVAAHTDGFVTFGTEMKFVLHRGP